VTTTIEAKVARLLADGRVFIRWSAPEHISAVVRGDSGIWDVRLDNGRWSCPCPARVTCSHMQAVMAVTVPDRASLGNGIDQDHDRPGNRTDHDQAVTA